jgi:Nucleotidyl transferase AbiEii toxin, Type IV TA system
MARKRMEGNEGNASEVSEIKLQISRRETPTLPTERRAQIEQSYFKPLPFAPAEIACLALPEILAEKIRACYQRNKARDMYDLGMFAMRPLDQALIRRLVVLKLWQAQDTFDPARLMQKFEDGREFDWDDLRQLPNRAIVIYREKISADCVRGFGFLANLTDDERTLARDQYQREQATAERLRAVPARGLREIGWASTRSLEGATHGLTAQSRISWPCRVLGGFMVSF